MYQYVHLTTGATSPRIQNTDGEIQRFSNGISTVVKLHKAEVQILKNL